ncbi:MAG: glutamate 5-kinase [Bacteroidota bacterium]
MDKLDKPILLIKLGTSTLTRGTDKISRAKLEDIAQQVVSLRNAYDVVLVSSGAIAAARQFLTLEKLGNNIKEKQALAAIGQPFLMRLITESFRDFQIPVGQCLLSYNDLGSEVSRKNIYNTIFELLKNNILPVINENDTTATEEIKFGDNDKLSAMVAALLEVDKLILVSNTYGVYDDQMQTIPEVEDLGTIRHFVSDVKSDQGTGGMISKLEAAEIAQGHGIETWILNGGKDGEILRAIGQQARMTRVLARR